MNNLIKLLLVFLLSDFSYTQILKNEFPAEGPIDIIEKLGDTVDLESKFLNEKGELRIAFPLDTSVSSGSKSLEVVATVLDFDGRSASVKNKYQKTTNDKKKNIVLIKVRRKQLKESRIHNKSKKKANTA